MGGHRLNEHDFHIEFKCLFLLEHDLGDSEQFLLRQRLHFQMPGIWALVQEVQTEQR